MSLDETSVSMDDDNQVRERLVDSFDLERLRRQDVFGHLVAAAASVARAPVAVVALVGSTHTHTISTVGVEPRSRPHQETLGPEVITRGHTLMIEDVSTDPRFVEDTPAIDGREVCFYFGQPLMIDNSIPVGTLSVIDFVPRRLSVQERGMLTRLARQVELQLEYIARQDATLEQSGLAAEIAASQRVGVRRQVLTNFLLHDVINAATAVKADADFVRARSDGPPEVSDALDDVATSVDRMADLLHSARSILLDPDAMLLTFERDVDLAELLAEFEQLHTPQLSKSKHQLTISNELEDARISGEPRLIREMFEGLLGASMAASDSGSSLDIQLSELDEQTVKIVYCDEGRPMSDTIKRQLFGRDGASDTAGAHAEVARDSIEGLTLCSMIVEAHGGTMHAENRDHSGRRFRIHLPR